MKPPPPRTRNGLLHNATHVVLPQGIVSTGFPAIEATCRRIGIRFDQWQADLNRCILAKNTAGLYAADTVVLSIPRQTGKTFDIGGVIFADSIINPGMTTVWTAHRFKVARESFNEMRAWAKSPLLKQHIDYNEITTAAGNECIPFYNGSRIVFAARERGAIRGFTKVRRLVLDEAQILTEFALSDLVPTMNQAVNPQLVLMGTPPKSTDPGEVFSRLRAEALAGESEGVLYVEFSAASQADPDDREAWRRANPSYPYRTPAKAILRMRKLLSVEDFKREALGMWEYAGSGSPIHPVAWSSLALDLPDRPAGDPCFFLDCSPGLASSSINAATMVNGRPYVELADYRIGSDWLVERAVELYERYPGAVFGVYASGTISALLPELESCGIRPQTFTNSDMGRACAHLQKLVANRAMAHSGDPLYVTALEGAVKRDIGDDLWAWSRRKSTDISPIVSATGALWLLERQPSYNVLRSVY